MELFNGQLHQQQPGGHPNVLASPLRDSPRVNLPSISKNPIDLSPSIPISRVYSHPDTSVYAASEDDDLPPRPVGSQPRVYSHPHTSVYVSSEDDDLPPRPRGSQTRVYSHPYAKSHLYSTSEDDDLPPRPKGSRKKVVSKAPPVGRKRSPSPPRRKNNLVQREFDFSDFQKFLFETDFDANRRLQYFVVPKDMYWPWKDEAEAHRQLFNAESNGFFLQKSELAVPKEPTMKKDNPMEASGDELADGKPGRPDPRGLFSVYSYTLIEEQIMQVQLAMEKSQEAALVNGNYEKIRDDSKMWAIGCDFTIFSRSERLGLQNAPIVPFNLHGTCAAARSFAYSEKMMRKLALLELFSVFELPPVSTSADLAKIAYAFYRGEEVPENVESLPNSPDAIPKEFRIDEDGRSDRAKAIAENPLRNERLQVFLQDLLISNHLEQVYTEKRPTMSGNMRVRRHSSYADVKEKLKAHERNAGKEDAQQTPRDCEKRQRLRRKAWWNNYNAIIAKAEQDFAKAEKAIEDAEFTIRDVTGFRLDGRYGISQNNTDSESTTEVGEGNMDGPIEDISHGPGEVGEGSNIQATESQASPEQADNVAKSKKSKGKGKSKKHKTAAASEGDNTPTGESSTILQTSASDVTATKSSEVEIAPEVATNTTSLQSSSKIAVEGSLSVDPSTAQPSVPSVTSAEGKSKKNKKKKKAQNAQAANDTASASSGKPSNVEASKSTPDSISQGQATKRPASTSVQTVKTPKEISVQDAAALSHGESATSGPVLSLDALGINLPMDSGDGAWETVKSRAAQKAKVNVSSANVGRSGSKTADSRLEVNQARTQQGSRAVSLHTKIGPPAKIAPVTNPALPPKDVRIFDPNEYPAMPTPPSDKSKAQGKDIHDLKPISAPELATSANKATPVTPALIPMVASGTVTPIAGFSGDIDSDPEDLYGASPPRKTRTTASSNAVSDEMPESTKGKDEPPPPAQGGSQPAGPESVVQVAEGKKISAAVEMDKSNVEKLATTPTKEKKSDSGTAAGPQGNKKPAGLKSTAPTANQKKPAPGPKVSANKSEGSNEAKGKNSVSSDTKSNVTPAFSVPLNQPKGMGKAEAKFGDTKAQTSSSEKSSMLSVGAEAAAADNKQKKRTHKLRRPKGKGFSSGQASEQSTVPAAESKRTAVGDSSVASSTVVTNDTPNQNSISQSVQVEKTPVEKVAPVLEIVNEVIKPGAETISNTQGTPVTQPAENPDAEDTKPKEVPVPWDLTWADLVSPTKPGSLKKRRCSVDIARDENNPDATQSPLRRSSISTGHASQQRVLQFGQLPTIAASSSATSDDPFVTDPTEKEPDAQQKDADVSFASSSTDEVEQRDSRASPEDHITPRTEVMLTPASPESYKGEPYLNKDGNLVTLFRRDAEISNFPGQKHHQRTHSGPAYGQQSSVPASNPIPGRSGCTSFNAGQGSHSHPPPAIHAPSQTTEYVVHQGGQEGSSASSLGGEPKGKGPEMGAQAGVASHGLSPIPEASTSSEVDSEEEADHNPPTTCTFCQQAKVPTAANPFHFCPLCGVFPGSPFYCSQACLLANAWYHKQACRQTPAYASNTNTDFGPTYRMETFPINNLYYLPDSAEKYRQKIFAMFCKYGDVPDIRAAHLKKWPDVDWARILPSTQRASVGDYHIFKSQGTHTGQNLSRAHVICTVKFPLNDGTGYKLMITRALNVALVTNDSNVIQFLYRFLRFVLMDPMHFNSFGAIEPHTVVMMEFKSQFFKEFGVLFNDAEVPVNVHFAWKEVENTICSIESRFGVLQYWLNAVLTEGGFHRGVPSQS